MRKIFDVDWSGKVLNPDFVVFLQIIIMKIFMVHEIFYYYTSNINFGSDKTC